MVVDGQAARERVRHLVEDLADQYRNDRHDDERPKLPTNVTSRLAFAAKIDAMKKVLSPISDRKTSDVDCRNVRVERRRHGR